MYRPQFDGLPRSSSKINVHLVVPQTSANLDPDSRFILSAIIKALISKSSPSSILKTPNRLHPIHNFQPYLSLSEYLKGQLSSYFQKTIPGRAIFQSFLCILAKALVSKKLSTVNFRSPERMDCRGVLKIAYYNQNKSKTFVFCLLQKKLLKESILISYLKWKHAIFCFYQC